MGGLHPWPWASKGYNFFMLIGLILSVQTNVVCADVIMSTDEGLKKIFPKAESFVRHEFNLDENQVKLIEESSGILFDQGHSTHVIYYEAQKGEDLLGIVYEDTVVGKWAPIHYMVGIRTLGPIVRAVVLDYQEIRGKPVAKNRFLKQYRGKTAEDPIQIRRDINGVTGATISSRSLTDGVRKVTQIHHLINKPL